MGYEFKLLMWVDNWGEAVGWGIRGAFVVIGGALMFFDKSGEAEDGDEDVREEQQA